MLNEFLSFETKSLESSRPECPNLSKLAVMKVSGNPPFPCKIALIIQKHRSPIQCYCEVESCMKPGKERMK